MGSLNRKVAVGAFWTVSARLIIKGLGFISTIILARILIPSDFGLIALAMITVAFFEIFTSFGFDLNIIQEKNVNNDTLNSAWTCKLIGGSLLMTLIVVFSFFSHQFFDEKNIQELIFAVAFIPIIRSFHNIGFVLHRKELELKKEFNLEVYAKISSFIVTISSALYLQNFWALVIGIYINELVRCFLSYVMHPFRPSPSLIEAKKLFKFSKWLLLSNLVIFINHKITDMIVAQKAGVGQLGHYTIGYEISNLPTTEIVFPLSRALFPAFSKVKNDLEHLRELFINFTQFIIMLAAPISFILALCSTELVTILLGEKWLPVIPVISLLAFYGLIRSSIQNIGSIFIALGRPDLPFKISVIRLFFIIPLLLHFVPQYGAEGGALSVLICAFITSPIGLYIVKNKLNIANLMLCKTYLPPILACMFAYLITNYISLLIFQHTNMIFLAILKVLFFATIYFVIISIYSKFFDKSYIYNSIIAKLKSRVAQRLAVLK